MNRLVYELSKKEDEMLDAPFDETYRCVMKVPNRRILKSETRTFRKYLVSGFTINKNGKEVPNGIEFEVWKQTRIEKP